MCTVSNIGDYWNNRWPKEFPWIDDPTVWPDPNNPNKRIYPMPGPLPVPGPSREEFDRLKKEVEALKELLAAAQKFDEVTNQPHCEHEDKVAILKKVAEMVGVDLKDVLS